jgi:hypothetical protein
VLAVSDHNTACHAVVGQEGLCKTEKGRHIGNSHAAGTVVEMRTPDEYREFAAECYRLASEAKAEAFQKMMEKMARAWSEVADELENAKNRGEHR